MTETAETKTPDVTIVRRFKKTKMTMGISFVDGSWFVFARHDSETDWSRHCGPYSTPTDARQWINDIVIVETNGR